MQEWVMLCINFKLLKGEFKIKTIESYGIHHLRLNNKHLRNFLLIKKFEESIDTIFELVVGF